MSGEGVLGGGLTGVMPPQWTHLTSVGVVVVVVVVVVFLRWVGEYIKAETGGGPEDWRLMVLLPLVSLLLLGDGPPCRLASHSGSGATVNQNDDAASGSAASAKTRSSGAKI